MDLEQHLLRQMAWSHATFGHGERMEGVIDHMRKELKEVEDGDGDAAEWVDVVILALDGLTRRLVFCGGERGDPNIVAKNACSMIIGKQTRNEKREWPDYRTADPNKAIEHVEPKSEFCEYPCPKCKSNKVKERSHESSCGGFDDYHYKCSECNHSWWSESPDA